MKSSREELSFLCRCQRETSIVKCSSKEIKLVRHFHLKTCSQLSPQIWPLVEVNSETTIDFCKNKVMVLLYCWLGDSTVIGPEFKEERNQYIAYSCLVTSPQLPIDSHWGLQLVFTFWPFWTKGSYDSVWHIRLYLDSQRGCSQKIIEINMSASVWVSCWGGFPCILCATRWEHADKYKALFYGAANVNSGACTTWLIHQGNPAQTLPMLHRKGIKNQTKWL